MYVTQLALLPPPVSVLKACRPLHRSHCASGAHAVSMLFVTHSWLVPLEVRYEVISAFSSVDKGVAYELSESKYLCTSKMRFSIPPSGLVTLLSASAEPLETNVSADVQLFPGSNMSCEVALPRLTVKKRYDVMVNLLTPRYG